MNKIYKLLIIGCLAFINQVSFASNQDVMNLFFMIEPHLKSYSKLKGLDITKHDLFEGSLGQVIELIDEFNRKVEEAQVEQHVNQTLISSQIHFRDYDHNIVSMEEILTPEGIENLRQGGVKFHKDLMRVRREAFRSGRTLRDSLNTNSRLEVKLSESDYQEWAKKCLQMTSDRYKRRERILNVMMERDLRSKSDKLTQVHKNISNIGPIFQFLNYSIQNGLNINDPEIYSYPEVHEILNGHSKIQEYLDNELANQFESSSIAPTKKSSSKKKKKGSKKKVTSQNHPLERKKSDVHSANQEDKTIKLLEKSKVPYISLFDKTFSNSSDIHPRLKRWLPSFSVNRVKNFIDGSYKKYLKLDQAELKKQWLDHQAIYFLKFFSESFPEDEAKKYFIQTEATRPTFLAQAVLLQDGELGRQGIVRLGKGADDETWIHARFEEFINMEFMETIQALCGDINYDMSLDDCIDEEFLPQKYSFEIMEDSIIQMSVPEGRIVIFPIKY